MLCVFTTSLSWLLASWVDLAFQGDREQLFEVVVVADNQDIRLTNDDSTHLKMGQQIREARMERGH